jgi:hypothetical protein
VGVWTHVYDATHAPEVSGTRHWTASSKPPLFSDDFFAVMRQLYNARADNLEIYRLSFVLIGVGTPNDLIANPARTLFSIGTQIDLDDFQLQGAFP